VAGQESLGNAVLYLTVDDRALRKGIDDAKKYVRDQLGRAFSGAGGGGGRGKSSGDQLQATRIITRRLGDELQRLADRGVNVTRQFRQLNQAIKAAEQGQTQTARARNKAVADFIRLEDRAYKATQKRQRLSAAGVFPPRSDIRGSLRESGSPLFSTRGARAGGPRESIDALFQAQKRRYALDQQIRSLETAGVRTDALRTRLGEITTAQAQRRFGLAKQLGDQLNFDLRKERDKLRIQQQQRTESARQLRDAQRLGGARSPIGGAAFIPGSPAAIAAAARAGGPRSSVRGSVDIPGSPAWIEAYQQNIDKAARAGGARSSIRGSINTPGSPAFIEAQQREIAKAAKAGGPTSPIRGSKDIPGSPDFIKEQVRQYNQELTKAARAGGPRSPIRGTKDLVGSPIFLEEQARRRANLRRDIGGRISSGLVGGAFPLLFGQGAGAAIGGGLGGLAGGSKFGFGLSLVGTVLGQAFDVGIQKAQLLADALDNPISKFQELAQAGLISSKATEKQVAALLEVGRGAEAAAVLEGDLTNLQVDPEKARELEQASRDLSNTWTQFGLNLAAVGSGPLQDVINGFNKLLSGKIAGKDFSKIDEEIAAAVAAARKQVAAERRTGKGQTLDLDIINAQFDKDKLRTLELQKQKALLEEADKLAVLGKNDTIRRSQVEFDFKKKNLELERQISEEVKRRQVLQLQIASATGSFGKTDAQRQYEQVSISIANTLAQFGPASLELKLALQEGANTLLNNAKSAAERFRDATRSLLDLRLGNLRFLPAKQRNELIREQIRTATTEARSRRVALRSREDVFAFNKFIQQERTARQEVKDAERNLADANTALTDATVQQTGALATLTDVMSQLIDKSWSVYVKVPGQNDVQAMDLASQLN